MANQSFTGNMAEMIKIARSYVNTRIELWKLSLLEKTSLAGAFFLSSVVIVLIIAFCLLFISLAFAYWYGQQTGDLAMGFLITAGFYVIVGLIFILNRKNIITGPIIRGLASILYKDDEPQEPEEKND
jgi:hypothetical protein